MTGCTFFVQTVKGREDVFEESRASIEASDIGTDYIVLKHDPAELPINTFFFDVMLKAMAEAPTEYVARLEDDIIVNKHIRHNALTWPALDDPEFGAGWLFVMQSVMGPSWFQAHRILKGQMYRSHLPIHGGVGYMFKTSHLPKMIEALQRYKDHGDVMDVGVSSAIKVLGTRLYLHTPSLLEHRLDVKSSMNHTHTNAGATAGGVFHPTWRR